MNESLEPLGAAPGGAQAPAWARDPEALRVERFVLGPEIGRGGMGRVHHAWDPVLRRRVALKLLPAGDAEQQVRLLREARNQAKIDHPNVCRIHDLGLDGDRPWIAMQLIEGRTLSELRPHLDPRAVAGLLAQVAAGLQAAHRAGLIHRDLKPANVLVAEGPDGPRVPYIVDFGLARDLHALDQTLSWAVMGTPAFMSPEQARGEALGPATDIYSLGATLYALLSGQPPYEGTTLGGLLQAQAAAGVRRLRRLAPRVPEDLETITLKCLEAEPAARYSDAGAVAEDLGRFLAGEPILARPVGPLGRLVRWARRKPALAATGGAALAAVLVLGAWNLRTRRLARVREQAAQRFAMEIREAEHLLRLERMLPLHDLRPAEARLLARLAAIERDLERLGGISRGPGHYALGRGRLALRDHPGALRHLEAAWEAGFQAPEVAYARGLAHLLQHAAELRTGGRAGTPEGRAALDARHLEPGLRWLGRSKGAQVDNPALGLALVASSQGLAEEADRLYAQALAEAPWLFEAWTGRGANLLAHRAAVPGRSEAAYDRAFQELCGMFQQAQRLAPSDGEARILEGEAWKNLYTIQSARSRRDAEPLRRAQAALAAAAVIRPGDLDLVRTLGDLALQRAFLDLGRGGDPAPALRQALAPLREIRDAGAWDRDPDRRACVALIHHLAWMVGESDARFGRDPSAALAEARGARTAFPDPDVHFAYAILVEARHRQDRGGDPWPLLEEARALLERVITNARGAPFVLSVEAEARLARALARRGPGPVEDLRAGIGAAEQGLRGEPNLAYLYYTLPVLQALRAQAAAERGQDPAPGLRAARASARAGVALAPSNAQVRAAAAETALVAAEVEARSGRDPAADLAASRSHLEAARRINPRDFRLWHLLARLELAEAARPGAEPLPTLERCRRACAAGAALKADAPEFPVALARAGLAEAEALAAAGRPTEEALRRGLTAAARALVLCPGHPEALDLRRRLQGFPGGTGPAGA